MKECIGRYVELVKQTGAPFTIEIIKSIATLCNEDPYELWYNIATSFLRPQETIEDMKKSQLQTTPQYTVSCWRCTACNRTFNDVKHLVNHITYFVRQKDKAHIELYQKIKKISDEQKKSFTEIATNTLRC